jgi:capsular exopolysaccharide synthesis family protein
MNSPQAPKKPDLVNGQIYDLQQETPLREYAAILYRGKWLILMTVAVVFSLTALYTFRSKPVYESNTLVLIDMKGKDGGMPVFDITGASVANKITNELEIMKSNATTESVAAALLARRTLSDTSTSLLPILRPSENNSTGDTVASAETIADRVSYALDFTPIKESDIIRITARSTDANEAALIASVFTEVYTSRNLNDSRTRSTAMREFLQTQMQSKRNVLDTTENDLQHYMRASGVVSLDAEANKVVDQLAQLEAQRDGLEVDRSSRQKNLESYKQELAQQEPNAAKAIGESNDSYIRLLQEQLAKLEVQRDVTSAQNPGMEKEQLYSDKLGEINGQIKEIKKKLSERTKEFLTSLLPGGINTTTGNASFLSEIKQKIIEQQIELGDIGARVKALNVVIADYERKFNQIPQKSINLAKLQRSRLSSEKLYLLVEEKYNEAAIKEKSEFGYVNVIDHAKVSTRQVSPRVTQNLILGLLLGLGLGVGLVLVRAFTDRRIRTPEDLKRNGFIALSSIGLMNGELQKVAQAIALSGKKQTLDKHLVAHYRPLSPLAESYRHLRTKVQYVSVDNPLHCIVVTSANPQEGKTTTTCNLAISFSQTERKVLLIDADMRRAAVHTAFGIPNTIGLNEHLFGKSTVDEVIRKNVLTNLDIVTCGMTPPNPSEILGSKRMKEFIIQMKERYDLVLFDSPPLLAVTDAAILATEADGVLLVASAGETQMAGVERVAEFLSGIGVNLLGVVLNKFDARQAYGGYHSSEHYGYYGYKSGYYREDGASTKKKAKSN